MNRSDFAEIKALELSKSLYVILIERTNGEFSLVKDPGMDRPWSTKNRKFAITTADEVDRDPKIRRAEAKTVEEAFNILQRKFAENHKLKFKL